MILTLVYTQMKPTIVFRFRGVENNLKDRHFEDYKPEPIKIVMFHIQNRHVSL